MDKATEMLKDSREVQSIFEIGGNCEEWNVGGPSGITRIEIYGEPGPHCMLPWAAIYRGEVISCRLSMTQLGVQYRSDVTSAAPA